MAVSRAMRRLLHVLSMEEDQCQTALAAALAELKHLENAREAAAGRDRAGRKLVTSSARSGELADRLAGLEETRAAKRSAAWLVRRIEAAESEVTVRREALLAKRIERRQTETLIEQQETREAVEAGRRSQHALDDWHLNRRGRDAELEQARKTNAGRKHI